MKAAERLAALGFTGKVASAYYSAWGNWYQLATKFPTALVDPDGYVIFMSEKAYRACEGLSFSGTVNCSRRIANLAGYVKAGGK